MVFQVSVINKQLNTGPFTGLGNTGKGARWGQGTEKNHKFYLDYNEFEAPKIYLCEDAKTNIWSWENKIQKKDLREIY